MYEFRPATERILRMKEKVRDRVIDLDSERMTLITEAYKKYDDVMPMIQRSLACKYLIENMSTKVFDDEIIVGAKGPNCFRCGPARRLLQLLHLSPVPRMGQYQ